ncbi:MAG: hypothetical protein HeimC3_11910 [Candidatus Heimdallarchaeota archaeon LC_3]|nr:MAG: hypothetical protein HeimC3_11910 [Candidatus Heimdallarchaeota archaeon LC_3]
MSLNTSIAELMSKGSPFQGRTYISIYIPSDAPLEAVIGQLKSEIKRSQLSTNFEVKGFAVMMLRKIINFLNDLNITNIPSPGRALFSVPIDHKDAHILFIKPKNGVIDLFSYNLDHNFYLNDEYF